MPRIFRQSACRQAKRWPKWKKNGRATVFHSTVEKIGICASAVLSLADRSSTAMADRGVVGVAGRVGGTAKDREAGRQACLDRPCGFRSARLPGITLPAKIRRVGRV